MRNSRLVVFAGALLVASWGIASAQEAAKEAPKEAAKAAHQYVGAKKCKMCHGSEKGGNQFLKWSESKHSKAFEVLATPKAKEIATKEGIDDPQKSDKCLSCHVTGHGEAADKFAATFVEADGVQCETCHGAGSDYIKMKTMQAIRDGGMKADDYGLLMPTKETCAKCHNEKATSGKAVDWPADSTKIAHPIPPGFKRGAPAPAEGAK